MPNKRVKSLKKEKGARAHRDHRSKKGRKNRTISDAYSKKHRRAKQELSDKDVVDEFSSN